MHHFDLNDDYEAQVIDTSDPTPPQEVECEFLTGVAGSGKTFEVKRRIEVNPKYATLCATTGIAAVNLNATTINSLLRYFDTDSLRDSYVDGRLPRVLHKLIMDGCERLALDEVSMMPAEQLDLIYEGIKVANNYKDCRDKGRSMKMLVTGDFCQLPPVKARWAFEAQCWHRFSANMNRLTKIWRQSDPVFLEALNAARSGDGGKCAELLRGIVTFSPSLDIKFDGTTIMDKNDIVDRANIAALQSVKGPEVSFRPKSWFVTAKPPGEWKNIPDPLRLKVGALVMILANKRGEFGEFEYINGDIGHVTDITEDDPVGAEVIVKLKRTGEEVRVGTITRKAQQRDDPPQHIRRSVSDDDFESMGDDRGAYFDDEAQRWVMGEITYIPLRLAYASTVHRSQGLSLDSVQLDIRGRFMASPNMAYVALSRVRTPQGLRIVGSPELLAKRIQLATEVRQWL